MNDQLEPELSRTLAGAAEGAPRPGPGLVAAVRHRRRRRRQRRAVVVAAACAVGLVATGATVALRPDRRPDPADRPQWSGAVPEIDTARPIGEVWPSAVRLLPATLPDGRGYSVHALLGDDRYLVLPKGVAKLPTARLSVYDAGAGAVTPLPGVPQVPTTNPIPPDPGPDGIDPPRETIVLGVAAGRVVWAIEVVRKDRPAEVEVWSARLDGTGPIVRIVGLDAPGNRVMTTGAVRNDAVYLVLVSYNGVDRSAKPITAVHRIPLGGGEVRRVRGTDGFWPNQGDPAWLRSTGDNVKVAMPPRGELWNVTTGERIPWRAHPDVKWLDSCDPMMCLGGAADGTWIAQRPDGTAFPWPTPTKLDSSDRPGSWRMTSTMDGRFGMISTWVGGQIGTVLWDRIGGGSAFVRLTGGEEVFATDHGVYSHQGDDDDPKTVVDLRAIG
jgi:hypothetical protein